MFEIVTPVIDKDLPVFKKVSSEIEKYYPEVEKLIAITNVSSYESIKNSLNKNWKVVLEDDYLKPDELEYIKLNFKERSGWYIQQIIKIRQIIKSNSKYVILWDSDTLPHRKIKFVDENKKVLFFNSREKYTPYYNFLKELGIDEPYFRSFITQIMCVEAALVKDYLSEYFENRFFETLNKVIKNKKELSEYELIGNYIHRNYPERFIPHPQRYNWTRLGQLLDDGFLSRQIKKYYQYSSYEDNFNIKNIKYKKLYLIKERLFGLVNV